MSLNSCITEIFQNTSWNSEIKEQWPLWGSRTKNQEEWSPKRGMYLDTIFNILLFICPAAHQWWGVAIDQCYQWTTILQWSIGGRYFPLDVTFFPLSNWTALHINMIIALCPLEIFLLMLFSVLSLEASKEIIVK